MRSMSKYQIHHFFSTVVVTLFLFSHSLEAGNKNNILKFNDIFEPSGVVQLLNGDIVIIEDEPESPLWVVEIQDIERRLVLLEKKAIVLQTAIDDLEGIAVDKGDELFLITSHSTKKNGARKRKREQLLKVDLRDINRLEESTDQLLLPVLAKLSQQYGPAKQYQSINIEGLSFDPKKEGLLIGFRSPMTGGHALILELSNQNEAVSGKESPLFGETVIELDIKGGIRAICYDHIAKRYIIANEIEDAAGKKLSALWSWQGRGTTPTRLKVPAIKKLKNIEGITILHWRKKNYLLLVCDDGKKEKNKGAHYLIINYADLP